jgi:hypothetical protein
MPPPAPAARFETPSFSNAFETWCLSFLFAFVSDEDEDHSKVDAVLEEHRGRRLSEIASFPSEAWPTTCKPPSSASRRLLRKACHAPPGVEASGHETDSGL